LAVEECDVHDALQHEFYAHLPDDLPDQAVALQKQEQQLLKLPSKLKL
jgi:hypothetical protein